MPRPAARPSAPILPPLMSPQQHPSWKQEVRPEPPQAQEPAAEGAPPTDTPEGSGEKS
jgi:hypothetical protein